MNYVVYTYEANAQPPCHAYTGNADATPISLDQANAAETKLKAQDPNLTVMVLPAEGLPV